jgi:hypothetical protein
VEGRIVVVLGVHVVHVVLGAVLDIGWHNALVVGRGDVELEVGRQDAGMARCWETFESLVMIDTQWGPHLLSVVLHMMPF